MSQENKKKTSSHAVTSIKLDQFQENPACIKHNHQDKIPINPGSDQLAKSGKTGKLAAKVETELSNTVEDLVTLLS